MTPAEVIARTTWDALPEHRRSVTLSTIYEGGRANDKPLTIEDIVAVLSALEEAGMVVVPREPTIEMILAGVASRHLTASIASLYRAMLAAKPSTTHADDSNGMNTEPVSP